MKKYKLTRDQKLARERLETAATIAVSLLPDKVREAMPEVKCITSSLQAQGWYIPEQTTKKLKGPVIIVDSDLLLKKDKVTAILVCLHELAHHQFRSFPKKYSFRTEKEEEQAADRLRNKWLANPKW